MKKILYIISLFPILPSIALAQTLSIQSFIGTFLTFSNRVLIPFALAIAFLFFLINVIRFFVIQGVEEDGQKNAKNLALYSVLAFVVLIVFWGVVNLLVESAGFSGKGTPTPDYVQKNEGSFNRSGAPNTGTPTAGSPADTAPATPAVNGSPTTPAGNGSPAGTTGGRPINLLPPQYDLPRENVNCPPGSSYDSNTNSCDYQ